MGGRGSRSSTNIKKLQTEYDRLVKKNTELYNDNNGFAITGNMEQLEKRNRAYKEWLNNRKKLGILNAKINGERDKRKSKNVNANTTFVNSYGEATTRYITNTTYEREQKRRTRQVLRNMGY